MLSSKVLNRGSRNECGHFFIAYSGTQLSIFEGRSPILDKGHTKAILSLGGHQRFFPAEADFCPAKNSSII